MPTPRPPQSPHRSPSQDQRAALAFLSREAGAFGGDPSRITLWGQSAGGASIANHLVSPRAAGLFSAAIIESGSFADWSAQPYNISRTRLPQVAANVGCAPGPALLSCLRAANASVVLAADANLTAGQLEWGPTIDGVEVLDDPRVQRAIDWITTYQRFDDGDGALRDDGDGGAPTGWPYHVEMCWGRHTCHMGAAKAFKALAEVPLERRTPAVRRTLAAGAEYFLRHHVHRRSHDLTRDAKPGWRRFGFPLMYQTDALELLGILSRLGREGAALPGGAPIQGDERMREALDLVASRADAKGRWKLQSTFNGRFVVDIETKGEPSRWVTAKALEVLGAGS